MTRSFPREEVLTQIVEAVRELALAARTRGLTLMVENLGPAFGRSAELAPLVAADTAVRFQFDVGHTFLGGERLEVLLAAFADRLGHVSDTSASTTSTCRSAPAPFAGRTSSPRSRRWATTGR